MGELHAHEIDNILREKPSITNLKVLEGLNID